MRASLTRRATRAGRSPVQLSATDTTFLLQERDGAHMHIGGVAVFEGPPPGHEQLRQHISERLALVPRFRQRLAQPPLALSRPWWVDDPRFNLDYHLRRVALPHPGEPGELKALIGRVFSQRLDRSKPLWEMYVVEGLANGGFALITKAHHALVDGVSGVDLASVIMDVRPEPEPVSGGVPFERHPAPSAAELTARSLAHHLRLPLSLVEYAAGAALYPRRIPRTLARLGSAPARSPGSCSTPPPPRRSTARSAPIAATTIATSSSRACMRSSATTRRRSTTWSWRWSPALCAAGCSGGACAPRGWSSALWSRSTCARARSGGSWATASPCLGRRCPCTPSAPSSSCCWCASRCARPSARAS